jgi:hypothetical protein
MVCLRYVNVSTLLKKRRMANYRASLFITVNIRVKKKSPQRHAFYVLAAQHIELKLNM